MAMSIARAMSKGPVFLIVRTVDTVILLLVIVWVGFAILMELAIEAMRARILRWSYSQPRKRVLGKYFFEDSKIVCTEHLFYVTV
jgi:hypothetical protein